MLGAMLFWLELIGSLDGIGMGYLLLEGEGGCLSPKRESVVLHCVRDVHLSVTIR